MAPLIDLAKLVEDETDPIAANGLELLSSRAIVRAVIDTAKPPPEGTVVFEKCGNALKEWFDPQWSKNVKGEATVIGWIHLFAELAEQKERPPMSDQSILEEHADVAATDLLKCIRLRPSDCRLLRAAIAGEAQDESFVHWEGRQQQWHKLLNGTGGGPPGIAAAAVGQTLVMHVLKVLLPCYGASRIVRHRAQLNLLLVPLIRAVYSHPDRAHAAYQQYFHGSEELQEDDCFHYLYAHDLGVLEKFRSRETTRRSEVLVKIQQTVAQQAWKSREEPSGKGYMQKADPLPPELQNEANEILHGASSENEVHSPEPKRTRLTQLTCLLRKLEDDDGRSSTKRFESHLEGIHYRSVSITDESPRRLLWPTLDRTIREQFLACVRDRYSAGHEIAFLVNLFGGGSADGERLPVWIQDGEITFLWLLAALVKVPTGSRQQWISSSVPLGSEPTLARRDVLGKESDSTTGREEGEFAPLALGKMLSEFASSHAKLFENQGNHWSEPTRKAWALVNFLERFTISRRPPFATDTGKQQNPLALAALAAYEQLAQDTNAFTFETLQAACHKILEKITNVETVTQVANASRLPSFALELILRDKATIPFSLFFFPLTFDCPEARTKAEEVIPGAFLAGTFAGLEWEFLPFVAQRNNYHLLTMIDAIRPIVDFEVGRVMRADQNDFRRMTEERSTIEIARQKEQREREEAERQANIYSAILPDIRDLSDLFQNAKSRVFRIQSALDTEWSGLFTPETHLAMADLFSNRKLPIKKFVGNEPKEVQADHEITLVEKIQTPALYQRLVYLAREVDHYVVEIQLGDNYRPTTITGAPLDSEDSRNQWKQNHANIFPLNKFLRALLDALIDESEESNVKFSPYFNMLLKLLAVDSAIAGRGLHVAQVAAALGMSAGITRLDQQFGFSPMPRVICEGRSFEGRSFNPMRSDGLVDLAKILEAESSRTGKVSTESPAMLRWHIPLPHPMQPFEILKSLRILGTDALGEGLKGFVRLKDWKLLYAEGKIVATLYCDDHFSDRAKRELWTHHVERPKDYHNLRTSFDGLCRAIGAFPIFRSVTSEGECQPASSESRFVISEYLKSSGKEDEKKSLWSFMLG